MKRLALCALLMLPFAALAEPPCHETGPVSASPDPADLVQGNYSLIHATTGERVGPEHFEGSLQIVFFGFTHCTTVCPVGMHTIRQTMDALGDDARQVTPVFITTDPARDTAPVVARYTATFGPRVVGLVGDDAAVAVAMRGFRVEAQKIEVASDEVYQMDHPAIFFLMGRDGSLISVVPSNSDPRALAETLRAAM